MTLPISRPPRKDPQKVTRSPELPPLQRSRASLAMSAAAARGVFSLQSCGECGEVCYPPRDICPRCLSHQLAYRPVGAGGNVIAETTVRTSTDLYFRQRMPWRVGTVKLDDGPVILCHLHGDVTVPARIRMTAKLDKSGNAVLMALPEKATENMSDDPEMRELTADPKFRRVLVTDGRSATGQALATALAKAEASIVFVGVAEPWKPFSGLETLQRTPNVEIMPLDLSDTTSVQELAGEISGKTDIIVNNVDYARVGGLVDGGNLVTARELFDANVFGLQRLAQAFGPAMRARGADGVNSAAAFVDILPVYALANLPGFGVYSASAAARHSLLQCLRSELRPGGVRVMSVFTGPPDDDWRQHVPPPKVPPARLAESVVKALRQGTEETYVGDVAKDVVARFLDDPKVLERELSL